MRRSFGPARMGGGGGGGGGGMIKTVHRAMRAGISGGASPESYSHAATATTATSSNRNQSINTTLSLSSNTNPSSPRSYLNHPVPAANWALTTSPAAGDDFDWEYIDGGGSDSDSVNGFYDDLVFGTVPSQQEVHHAVSSLQEVLEPVSFAQLIKNRETYGNEDDGVEKILSPTGFHKLGSDLDWIEPSMQLCSTSTTLHAPSSHKVYDAFHLLQTEPSVQRMVISLSSDKAVWDAVMNNEVVRELRESVIEDKISVHDGSKDEEYSNPVTQVLRWIFVNTKDRVIEIVEKITTIVNELVQPMKNKEQKKTKRDEDVGQIDLFEEKLRSSFFLSIMVLLIVLVSRSRKC